MGRFPMQNITRVYLCVTSHKEKKYVLYFLHLFTIISIFSIFF